MLDDIQAQLAAVTEVWENLGNQIEKLEDDINSYISWEQDKEHEREIENGKTATGN